MKNAGFYLNGKHTYDDYGLYLSAPPDFGVPSAKVQTVDIPGRDGPLDFTEAATGEVKYNNRKITLTFATEIKREHREALRSDLMNDLHGRVVEAIYDFDSDWYYTGRASVSFSDVQSWKMKVVVTIDAAPYKLAKDETIITIAPSDFTSETISLGQATENMRPNSIFTFGTSTDPQLNLNRFGKLVFVWDDPFPLATPYLQIVDASGAVYNGFTVINALFDGVSATELPIDSITGIDKSRVYRILCQYRPLGRLYAVTTATATALVEVDRKTVVPVWTTSVVTPLLINGSEFELPIGTTQNYRMRLTAGENQVTFVSDVVSEPIEIKFRNGRL